MMNINKFILGTVLGLGLASSAMAAGTNLTAVVTNQPVNLNDERARISYALGMMTGQQWKMQGLAFDPDIFAQGVKDATAGGQPLLTPEEAQQAISNFRNEFNSQQQRLHAEQIVKNKAAGEAFLATNKNNPGVITLPDGLQYLVLTKGNGMTPSQGSMMSVHYRGTLVDGTEFDSSLKRGQPFQLRLGIDRVIAGWTEALQKMPAGSKWKLFIPADLAYGEQGRQGIPPNSVLIFEVDVLSVQPPPPPGAPVTSDIIKVQGTNAEVIKVGDAAKAHKK